MSLLPGTAPSRGLPFGRTVVLRYRYELEPRRLAPATINLRLAAVRRLAYEASDNGLLNPDLAAGIRRVKGAKRLVSAEGHSRSVALCDNRSTVCLAQNRGTALGGLRGYVASDSQCSCATCGAAAG